MPRARLLAALLLLVALGLPATAGAAPAPAPTPASAPALLATAAGIAERYWGAVPCGGRVRVVAQRPLMAGAEAGTDAWATFATPLGANNLAAAPAGYTDCAISFGRSRWPTRESMRQDWDMLCLTMVHEMGHLLGHPHDTAPHSVMAAVFTDTSSVPATCRASRPA